MNWKGFDTTLVHGGEPKPTVDRAVGLPIFQTSTYEFTAGDDPSLLRYIRLNNTPNHVCLGEKLAQVEGTEAAVVTASGMAAITTALLALVEEGGHLIAQDNLYGGTYHFLKENFPKMGRSVSFFAPEEMHRLESLMRPETRAVYVESVSNPLLKIPDLAGIAAFAKRKGILSFIDNTFPSPVNFNPAALGYDVILHSATKYLNGHTDVVAGSVLGKQEIVNEVLMLLKDLGGSLDPHACFLLHRGLKTLGVRVRRQNETALFFARGLEQHPRVSRVIYPGLPSHPDHGRAKELFRGFGGMLAFEYRGEVEALDQCLGRLRLPFIAPSLGGVETLVTRPVISSHSWMPREDRERIGLKDTLVRVSVGLEDAEDLLADFRQAFDDKGLQK